VGEVRSVLELNGPDGRPFLRYVVAIAGVGMTEVSPYFENELKPVEP
jgi:hypothetical protein